MIDIDKLPEEIRKELLSDDQFKKQARKLNTPGGVPSTRKMLDEVDFGLMFPPVAGRGGGRARTRQWLPWGPSERDASLRVMSKDVPRAHTAEIKRLCEILWGTFGDHRALLGYVREFSGKQAYEPYINYWLGVFVANLKMLYPHLLDEKKLAFFHSDDLKNVVLGLTHGFFDGYTVAADGQLIPPKTGKTIIDPEDSLKSFSAEPIAATLAAKPRE